MHYTLDIPSAELADRLAGEYSVMLAPGSAFGYEHHLRIGVGQTPRSSPKDSPGQRPASVIWLRRVSESANVKTQWSTTMIVSQRTAPLTLSS